MPRRLHSLAAILLLAFPALGRQSPSSVVAHCIDVGQADCTLLEFPCGAVLIDAGADTQERADALVTYLRTFFDRRTDLQDTLAAVYVTHAHIDHTRALREVAEAFTINGFIDNGHREGMGGGDERWLVDAVAGGRPTLHREVIETDGGSSTGLTDSVIDPVACATCDPRFTVLSGGYPQNTPGWPSGEFENQNNHSLVLRVDFGESSFLFSGDLEEDAIETLLLRYDGSDLLDVDLYHVGHHGSHNATNADFLEAMSPQAAVISMGRWNDGRRSDGSAKPFTTFAYGHPRRVILDELSDAIGGYRSTAKTIMAAEGARDFDSYRIRKRIYATGWDRTVRVRATQAGQFTVTVNH